MCMLKALLAQAPSDPAGSRDWLSDALEQPQHDYGLDGRVVAYEEPSEPQQ